jgi:hypothetical protein
MKEKKTYEWPKRRKTLRLGPFSSSKTVSYPSGPIVRLGIQVVVVAVRCGHVAIAATTAAVAVTVLVVVVA